MAKYLAQGNRSQPFPHVKRHETARGPTRLHRNAEGCSTPPAGSCTRSPGSTRPLIPMLRELVLRPDTPLDQDVKDMIARQLDNAEHRLAAVAG